MSLLPFLFEDYNLIPRQTYKRQGSFLNDLVSPSVYPRELFMLPNYLDALNAALQDNGDQVNIDKDKFQANFDVQHFKPQEITVKVSDDNRSVTIECEHEEKQDEHGQIYRHFLRKYVLPDDCDVKHLESKLSSDGVLSLTAPRLNKNKGIENHRSIPIIRTGQPAKSVEKQPENLEKMDTK